MTPTSKYGWQYATIVTRLTIKKILSLNEILASIQVQILPHWKGACDSHNLRWRGLISFHHVLLWKLIHWRTSFRNLTLGNSWFGNSIELIEGRDGRLQELQWSKYRLVILPRALAVTWEGWVHLTGLHLFLPKACFCTCALEGSWRLQSFGSLSIREQSTGSHSQKPNPRPAAPILLISNSTTPS